MERRDLGTTFLKEKISSWGCKDPADHDGTGEDEQGEGMDFDKPAASNEASILGSNALDDLVARLRSRCLLHGDGLDDHAARRIQRKILDGLPRDESRGRHSRERCILFHLEWGHIANLPWRERQARLNSMTITACSDNAQLVTGEQYLRQTWPWSGRGVLDLVRAAAFTVCGKPHVVDNCHCMIPNGE